MVGTVEAEHRERVLGFLGRASGKILTGANAIPGPGIFVEPTLITDVEQSDEIVLREVFGPAVTIQRFAADDQALAWANHVSSDLCASVWTRDVG